MEIKVGKNIVEVYSSPETLSVTRYQKFTKYLMIDEEVGSSLQDYDKRIRKAIDFVKHDLKNEALKELENNRQNVFNCLNEYSPKNMALCVIVKRINKTHYYSTDSQTLGEIERRLDEIGFTKKMLDKTVEAVKKKVETVLKQYYPNEFKNNNTVQHNSHLKRKLSLELDSLVDKTDNTKRLFDIEKKALSLFPVNIWNVHVKGNMERKMEVDFKKFLFAVSEHTSSDIENLSVFDFYALIEQLKDKADND